jgi:hypothetical protein
LEFFEESSDAARSLLGAAHVETPGPSGYKVPASRFFTVSGDYVPAVVNKLLGNERSKAFDRSAVGVVALGEAVDT